MKFVLLAVAALVAAGWIWVRRSHRKKGSGETYPFW